MAKRQQSAGERARQARAAAVVCALAMLGVAAWLVWKHTIGTVVALDAERTLTLQIYLIVHALALYAAAQPARALSRPLSAQLAVLASARASVNVVAAAFFAIDVALAWSVLSMNNGPVWVLVFLIPAGTSVWLLFSSFGVAPEEPDDISDEDLTEAALILTESQRRWSWNAIYAMAGYMAFTRTAILAAYYAAVVIGIAIYEWLDRSLFETGPLGASDLREAGERAVARAGDILTQSWLWIVFFLVAILPPLFILLAAVLHRYQVRRDRARLRTLAQSPAARLLTSRELLLLRRASERRIAKAAEAQRPVS